MKAKIGLFLFTMLAWASMGFAAPGDKVATPESYYNLVKINNFASSILALSQGAKPCSDPEWKLSFNGREYTSDGKNNVGYYSTWTGPVVGPWASTSTFTDIGDCIASVDDADPANLAEALEKNWIKVENMRKVPLELWSDLDLHEFAGDDDEGLCSKNHVPLTMMDSTSFNGNHFTVKHLCYAATITEDSPMTTPVGFFKSASNVSLMNLNINGVRIYINGESTNGADYYPVGAFVGTVNLVTVDSITLANDSIQAPFAGGLVGLVKNSTISNISGDDDILITNKTVIKKGYAGSAVMEKVSDHTVFLGGLAGAAVRSQSAEDPTFVNDSVKVDVHDYATGHKSALGGIAGMFETIGGTQENLQVFTKYKDNGEIVATRISGGTSMGGLFGLISVHREVSGATPSANVVIKGGKFDGKIYNASAPYDASVLNSGVIAVGGLVGFDSTAQSSSLQFVESYAKVDVKDSLKVKGIYQYYAGGIMGYGGSCESGSVVDSEYLSIVNSKTEGAIALSASGAEVEGVHSDAYLGGIVGSACLARARGKSLTNDTSLVTITSKVKTGLDKSKVSQGNNARDSVYVGGIIGYVTLAVSQKADTLSGLYYDGSISVEDSLNNVYVGGLIGGFVKTSGNKLIHLEKSIARSNGTLISYKAKEAAAVSTGNNMQVAVVGGACGACDEIGGMNFVGVSGDINVMGKHAGDSMYVGGLVGSTNANNAETVVKNSYSIGNILVSANNAGNAKYVKKVGYLVGSALLSRGFEFISCYHYGEDKDDLPLEPFGLLSTGADVTSSWRDHKDIHFVIRNGSERKLQGGPKHQNGTELATTMKTSKFAGFLNGAYEKDTDYGWSFVKDSNNDLPIFAYPPNTPVAPDVVYTVTFVDMQGTAIKSAYVDEHGKAVPPTLEEMENYQYEGYTFTGNWLCAKDYEDVTSDMTVTAEYSINKYKVMFFNYDGSKQIGDTQEIEYMKPATAPEAPAREGYTFTGWDNLSYTQVKENLKIKATYAANKYRVEFRTHDGLPIIGYTLLYDAAVSAPVDVARASTDEYTYTFKGWSPEVTVVKGDAIYTAVYDSAKVKYEVVFVDEEGVQIGESQWVEYGAAAVAPKAPVREGYTFVRWIPAKFDNIVKYTVVNAVYEKNPESSSSVVSSSSVPSSSSSGKISSSSEVAPKSSSSSSARGTIKIVKPTIEMSGYSAVLLTFGVENADTATTAHVVVTGKNGTILEDDIPVSVVDGGQWELTPAPIGKFKVTLTVGNKVQSAKYEDSFEVVSEVMTAPGSWQLVSLSAFDKRSFDSDDAVLYWWDEQNPVGDFWQYHAYGGEKTDATRGFWYGTTDGKPLVIRESTGSKDSEIVWELDNRYSGWNLVANPYGWKVDLTKGVADDGVEVFFWRWDSEAGHYDPMPTEIGPYEAVWAKVSKKTTWRMSAAPVFTIKEKSAAEKKKALHKDAAGVKGAWNLMVSLADEFGKKDSWNMIGAGAEESLEEPPAGMGNRVSLAIREVLADGKKGAKLAKSIKAVADEYRWTLDMSASSVRDGKLTFNGIAELNKLGLKLYVESDGKSKELRDGESLNVALMKSAKQVEVRVAAGNAVVASSKISGFGSTLAGGTLQVGFTAPDALAGARASYAVVGVDGKKVASGSFKAASGTNQFSLKAPKTGVYFVKIKVGSQQLSGKVLVK